MRRVLAIVAVLLFAGCGPAAYIHCKGKGSLTGQGHVSGGYGGANMFSVSGDCGEGFEYYRGSKPPVTPSKATAK